jgi:hypothetical protein
VLDIGSLNTREEQGWWRSPCWRRCGSAAPSGSRC